MNIHKKGHIIDESCTVKGELVEYNNKVYSCTLNQTDLQSNKNKYYIIQLIKSGNNYTLFTKYGRISEKGKTNIATFNNERDGIIAFEKQFKTKTGNSFTANEFVKKPGKYFKSEVSYEEELDKIKMEEVKIPDSKLDPKIQELIKMLSNDKLMTNALVSLDIDLKKMPLGKIKQSQLKLAGDILIEIEKILDKNMESKIMELTNNFYTLLPMSFGRKKPALINNSEILQKYKDMIDELTNIAIAVQITQQSTHGENPLDSIYKNLNTTITPLSKETDIWKQIEIYIKNSHGPTHASNLELVDIFEVNQHGKKELFDKCTKNIDNHKLLWHGTGMANICSILTRGLLLDPNRLGLNVPITGKMFSYGLYYSCCVSKSFNYCNAESSNDIACMLLNEVALGKQLEKVYADCNLNNNVIIQQNCHSVKGVGQYEYSSEVKIGDIFVPNGPIKLKNKKNKLYYNEHIIYQENQSIIRYLVLVKNNGGYGIY